MRNNCRIFIIFIICTLFFSYKGFCQYNDGSSPVRNSIYIETATKSSPYTINYDRIFHVRDKVAYTYRIGFSYAKEYVTIPIGVSLLTGKAAHHGEFGITIIPYLNMHDAKNDPTNLYIYAIPSAGYRYQKPEGGLFFKVSAGPAVFFNPAVDNIFRGVPKLYAYGSLALGLSF